MHLENKERTQVDQSVVMLVTFRVKPERNRDLKQSLLNDLAHARQESGFISMDLFTAKDEPNTLVLLERWQNQEAFDHHLAQPHTQAVLDLAQTALTSPMQLRSLTAFSPSEHE